MHGLKLSSITLALLLSASAAMAGEDLADLDFHWLHQKRAAERLFSEQKYAEAVEALRKTAAAAPDDDARFELLAMGAVAQAHLGNVEQALGNARSIASEAFSQYAELSILSVQNNTDTIVSSFADVSIEDWPERIRAESFQMRGQAYEAVDQHQEAITDYERCVQAAEDQTQLSLPVLLRIAGIHRKLEQNEEAKAAYRRVIETIGDPPQRVQGGHNPYPLAVSRLATILAEQKKYEQAIGYIDRYPPEWSTSRSFGILRQRGDLYREWGKPKEALAAYRDALVFAKQHESHYLAPRQIQWLTETIDAVEARIE